jgi:hypothetical protein
MRIDIAWRTPRLGVSQASVKSCGVVEIERLRDEFERETTSVWLNTAHQSRLPRRAALALSEAIEWKLHPEALASADRFTEVPERLRHLLARVERPRVKSSSPTAHRTAGTWSPMASTWGVATRSSSLQTTSPPTSSPG